MLEANEMSSSSSGSRATVLLTNAELMGVSCLRKRNVNYNILHLVPLLLNLLIHV